jgi:subtilisin family serine protease
MRKKQIPDFPLVHKKQLLSLVLSGLTLYFGGLLYFPVVQAEESPSAPSKDFVPLRRMMTAPKFQGPATALAERRILRSTEVRADLHGEFLLNVPGPQTSSKQQPSGIVIKPDPTGQVSKGIANPSQTKQVRYRENEVLVVFKKGFGKSALTQALSTRGLSIAKTYDKLTSRSGKTFARVRANKVKTAQQILSMLKKDPRVEAVSLIYGKSIESAADFCGGLIPNDVYFPSYQYSLCNWGQTGGLVDADIDASEAWLTSTGSSNAVIAILDTGVRYNHPDLKTNIWTNSAEANGTPGVDDDGNGYVDDLHGIDTVEDDSDPLDVHGHGTHVAGIIGAVGNDGYGVAGVNWTTRIMAIQGFSPDGYMYDDDELGACRTLFCNRLISKNFTVFA